MGYITKSGVEKPSVTKIIDRNGFETKTISVISDQDPAILSTTGELGFVTKEGQVYFYLDQPQVQGGINKDSIKIEFDPRNSLNDREQVHVTVSGRVSSSVDRVRVVNQADLLPFKNKDGTVEYYFTDLKTEQSINLAVGKTKENKGIIYDATTGEVLYRREGKFICDYETGAPSFTENWQPLQRVRNFSNGRDIEEVNNKKTTITQDRFPRQSYLNPDRSNSTVSFYHRDDALRGKKLKATITIGDMHGGHASMGEFLHRLDLKETAPGVFSTDNLLVVPDEMLDKQELNGVKDNSRQDRTLKGKLDQPVIISITNEQGEEVGRIETKIALPRPTQQAQQSAGVPRP